MSKWVLRVSGVALVLALTTAAHAQNVQLKAKGSGANGDGSSFTIKSEYQSDPTRTEAKFKIRGGVAGETHTVCFSTDGCTYTFQMTVGVDGKASAKFDTHDGNMPPDFPALSVGDQLIVDGVVAATYKPKR